MISDIRPDNRPFYSIILYPAILVSDIRYPAGNSVILLSGIWSDIRQFWYPISGHPDIRLFWYPISDHSDMRYPAGLSCGYPVHSFIDIQFTFHFIAKSVIVECIFMESLLPDFYGESVAWFLCSLLPGFFRRGLAEEEEKWALAVQQTF